MCRNTLAEAMSEKLSIDAKVAPAVVADDAVGVSNGEEKHWFIAYVGSRAEKSVRDKLLKKGYEAFAATQWELHVWKNGRRKKIEQPVITQYVFVRVTEKERLQIVEFPEIHFFLTDKASATNEFGRHSLATVPNAQMEMLMTMLADSENRVQFATTGFSIGEEVRVLGWGDNITGSIVRLRGDKSRYIGIRIPQLGCAYMEVSPKLLVKV